MRIAIKPFIFGISGTKLTEDELNLFKTHQVFGFILFKRNIESSDQLSHLVHSLKELYQNRDVPIFVDQEGGRVSRIKPPIASKLYESAANFGNIYDHDKTKALEATKQNYCELTSELISFGINGPLAPVCDIRYQGADDVIGDRSFGDSTRKVIDLANSAISGICDAGGIACIKHIPGHGRSTKDSHHHLPFIDASLEELEKSDFMVFKELSRMNDDSLWAMTAHIVYNALDKTLPVTLSKVAINYIRNVIGFKGKLVSDAIEMKALHEHIFATNIPNIENNEIGERIYHNANVKEFIDSLCLVAQKTLDAGCDLVFHCTGDIQEMTALCESV
jgi:beta-glucosidase